MKHTSTVSRFKMPEMSYDTFQMGIVVDYNPASATCDVQLSRGGLVRGIPVLNTQGSQHGTDMSWTSNLRGAAVAVIRMNNQLYVMATIPSPQTKVDTPPISEPATLPGYGGGNQDTYGKPVDRDFSTMRSKDHLTGDKILKSDGGAEVTAMKEGVARLKASPLCQFILCKIKDLGRLVTRVFQHFTDFGEVNFTHKDTGRVGVYLCGGADYMAETHPGKAKWTIQTWLGDHPDNAQDRLFVRVNDVDNAKYVTLAFDIDGNAYLHTTNDTKVKAEHDIELDADVDIQLHSGVNMSLRADGWGQYYAQGRLLIKSDTELILKGPKGTIIL